MRIIEEAEVLDANAARAVALGNFDGLHRGHQQLIKTLMEKAKAHKLQSCVYTFKNHTLPIITKGQAPPQITDLTSKGNLLEAYGVETLVLAEFSEEIMNLNPSDFARKILVETLRCKVAVIGFDYRFGAKASGNAQMLQALGEEMGFSVCIIEPVTIDGEKVSSTAVRRYVQEGDIQRANEFLGRSFSLYGQVVHGEARGRKLGYPTANILVPSQFLIPKEGVYATRVMIQGQAYPGATSVGTNPTFEGRQTSIETHILDYEGDLYGQYIEVQFQKGIRGNLKFDQVEGLIDQMAKDIAYIKMVYKAHPVC